MKKLIKFELEIEYESVSEEPLHIKEWWARDQIQAALERERLEGALSHSECCVNFVNVELSNKRLL